MTGVDDDLVREAGQARGERLVHRLGIAPGQVGPTTALKEQRVARHQAIVKEDALTSRRVAWWVDELDWDRADRHRVPTGMLGEGRRPDGRRGGDPWSLRALDVHRH